MGSIPSPSSGEIDIGSVQIHAYGLMLLLGIVAATWLTGRHDRAMGLLARPPRGTWSPRRDVGRRYIVGARLYHVVTSWSTVNDDWWEPFAVWEGGLGVWGGIAAGVLVGAWVVHRSGESVYAFMDAVAPGILLAQAIGRWGNYFNQELFGKPTDLPWGLRHPRDPPQRVCARRDVPPDVPLRVALVPARRRPPLARRSALQPEAAGGSSALYVLWYCVGRFGMELLRIDETHEFLGLRLNAWVAIGVFVLALIAFIWSQRREEQGSRRSQPPPSPPEGPTMAVPKGRVR